MALSAGVEGSKFVCLLYMFGPWQRSRVANIVGWCYLYNTKCFFFWMLKDGGRECGRDGS